MLIKSQNKLKTKKKTNPKQVLSDWDQVPEIRNYIL